MATLNGTDLGKLQQEKLKMDSGIVPMPLPDSDATQTVLMPVMGPVTYIDIAGKKGGTFADAQTFIAQLEDWITKGGKVSESNLTYVGDLNTTSRSVRVINGGWTTNADEPNMVYYNLQMVQGTFT